MVYTNILGKNRSKIEIIADILEQSKKPIKKTHIQCRCDLSFRQLKRYLIFLKKRALIRRKVKAGTVTYQTTKNGREFLTKYFSITQLLQSSALEN